MGSRLGAAHAEEIPLVFDTLGLETEPVVGPDPPQRLADTMHRAWVEFAKTGDPGWHTYDTNRRATMHFAMDSKVVDNPLRKELELWSGVVIPCTLRTFGFGLAIPREVEKMRPGC